MVASLAGDKISQTIDHLAKRSFDSHSFGRRPERA